MIKDCLFFASLPKPLKEPNLNFSSSALAACKALAGTSGGGGSPNDARHACIPPDRSASSLQSQLADSSGASVVESALAKSSAKAR